MSLQTSSDSSSTSFEWSEYLLKTNGRPADPKCFKQSLIPPQNHFEVDTLLEAEDQRSAALDVQTTPSYTIDQNKSRTGSGLGGSVTAGSGLGSGGAGRRSNLLSTHPVGTVRRFRAAAFSLAKVVEAWGSRLRIRLVGTDDRNDCWFLVDSDQIRPYPSGNALQPPFGYMHNHLVWNRTLKKATEGTKFADPSWFIEPPPDPADNFFRVGDKLEAVDRRNTQLICPATVGAVNGQHILVSFDGWSGAFDYWTRFDSRELFPVGWCKLADYPLQPPGPNALRSPASHSTPGPPSKVMLAPPTVSGGVFPLDISSVGETPAASQRKKPKPRAKSRPESSTGTPVLSLPTAHSRSRRIPRLTRKRRRKPPRLLSVASERVSARSDLPLTLAIPSSWTTDGALNKPCSDASHPPTESADSSMLCSPPPPIIHPATIDDDMDGDNESLLNVTGSSLSDQPPPAIEVAVTSATTASSSSISLLTNTPLPDSSLSSSSRGRRTSSSSDCVVRLQAKSPPVPPGAGSDHMSKPELKSWQVVTTEPRSKPKKKSKLARKYREHSGNGGEVPAVGLKKKFKFMNDTLDCSSRSITNRKAEDFPVGPTDRDLKPGPLTVDTTEDHLQPERRALSAGDYAASEALDTRDKCKLAPMITGRGYAQDYFPSHHEAVLYTQQTSSYGTTHCSSAFGSIVVEPRQDDRDSNPTTASSAAVACAVDQQHSAEAGAPDATNWYSSAKLDYYQGTKVTEVYSSSQVPDDYLDVQSLAPHVSSSTVSPSSLDLGPCPLPNPLHWTIDEVYHYIATRDSSLLEVAQKFKHHEIDGQALLLLTMEALRNYLKIKLGPALKVDHLISRLKRGVL